VRNSTSQPRVDGRGGEADVAKQHHLGDLDERHREQHLGAGRLAALDLQAGVVDADFGVLLDDVERRHAFLSARRRPAG
jgi:hypothetical protein